MKFFEFTKKDYEYLIDECLLDDDYKKLLWMEIMGYSRPKMAMELHISESKLDVMIKNLKKKIKKIL